MTLPALQPSSTRHLIAKEAGLLSKLLKEELFLDEERIQFLFSLGSIFLNYRRIFQDQNLNEGDYIRAHTFPKRFEVENISWGKLILFENEDFLIIDKPAGIPVHATLDNFFENVIHCLSRQLDIPLHVTARIDVPVSGLLVIAKTKTFQSYFNRLLVSRKVTKRYQALTRKPVPLGLHTHYMDKSVSAPKKLHLEPEANRLQCQLEVLNTLPSCDGNTFQTEINLITGRTHQIRAQLAFMDCPILGDHTYGGEIGEFIPQRIALKASYLSFGSFEFSLPSVAC